MSADDGESPAHDSNNTPESVILPSGQPLMGTTAAPKEHVVVDLDWRSVALFIGALAAGWIVLDVLNRMRDTTTYVVLGLFLALALNQVVAAVERRLHGSRASAVFVVVGTLVVALGLFLLLALPPAISQSRDLARELPHVIDDLESLPLVGDAIRDSDIQAKVEKWLTDLPARLAADSSPVERALDSVRNGLEAAFWTFAVAIAALLDGPRLIHRLRQALPVPARERGDRLGELTYRAVGRYAAGSVFVAMLAGTVMLVAGLLLGVPLTPLLAVWNMVWNLVPQIGGFFGGAPFVIFGFSQGPVVGLACLAYFLIYQQIENHVIQPIVVGQAVDLSPLATMTAALVGVAVAGVVGALIAVPFVGVMRVIWTDLRKPTQVASLP